MTYIRLPLVSSSISSLAIYSAPHLYLPLNAQLCKQTTPCRRVATARRTVKALRPTPAPSAAPGSKHDKPSANTIVFNPPPSAPTPYHTPPLFLPNSDPRRSILLPSHANMNPYATPNSPLSSKELPQPVREHSIQKFHLTQEDVEEMRRLRASDEWTWTRKKLAEKFGCSEFFVNLCTKASEQRKEWARQNQKMITDRWGERRRVARLERQKRRMLWYRDA